MLNFSTVTSQRPRTIDDSNTEKHYRQTHLASGQLHNTTKKKSRPIHSKLLLETQTVKSSHLPVAAPKQAEPTRIIIPWQPLDQYK